MDITIRGQLGDAGYHGAFTDTSTREAIRKLVGAVALLLERVEALEGFVDTVSDDVRDLWLNSRAS